MIQLIEPEPDYTSDDPNRERRVTDQVAELERRYHRNLFIIRECLALIKANKSLIDVPNLDTGVSLIRQLRVLLEALVQYKHG